MRRILPHGHNDGYILLDAIICLFIAGTALVSVYGNIAALLKLSAAEKNKTELVINARNKEVEDKFSLYLPDSRD